MFKKQIKQITAGKDSRPPAGVRFIKKIERFFDFSVCESVKIIPQAPAPSFPSDIGPKDMDVAHQPKFYRYFTKIFTLTFTLFIHTI
ncbi:MAG: hypothetical protein C4518_00060 [Desulfobacteraceae bacterium]|nr:MAG: hypothetical protein C4518_00060 [Desulfobacteraceae bacterium]